MATNMTNEQVQQMIDIMRQQMEQLQTFQTENAALRANQQQNNVPVNARPKTKAPDRPIVNINTDEREWELFKDSWNRYKAMTRITDQNILRMELRESCSQEVNKLLFEYIGSDVLDTASEADLLEHIKRVAVKGTHKEVHRITFFRLAQMDGETVTQYVARLKSQAVLCQFKVTCTTHEPEIEINYSNDMITQQLISGLKDKQHQARILSESPLLPTLEQKIERLECFESTEESADLMSTNDNQPNTSTANQPSTSAANQSSTNTANRSAYRRSKDFNPSGRSTQKCKGCGRTQHEGKTMARKDCPAFNKTCNNCGIKGHFQAVCQKKSSTYSRSNAATEEEIEEPPSIASANLQGDFRLAPFTTGGR